MDLILGGFADAQIADLSDQDVEELENLLEVPDPDLYAAFSGGKPLDPEYATGIFTRIQRYVDEAHRQ